MKLKEGVFYKFETKNCSVCKVMEPLFNEFITSNPEVEFAKVIATDEMDLCEKYGIMAMPTFIFIQNEQPYMISGLVEKRDFNKFTKQFLKTV